MKLKTRRKHENIYGPRGKCIDQIFRVHAKTVRTYTLLSFSFRVLLLLLCAYFTRSKLVTRAIHLYDVYTLMPYATFIHYTTFIHLYDVFSPWTWTKYDLILVPRSYNVYTLIRCFFPVDQIPRSYILVG